MSATPLPIGEIIGFWFGAAATLIIFSFIYKDNPVYKFGEHLFLGFALGYSLVHLLLQRDLPQRHRPAASAGRRRRATSGC